jgi:hypothetical protein
VKQLRQTFRPEFRRPAIFAQDGHSYQPHSLKFTIISKLIKYKEIYKGIFRKATKSDLIANVEIPAETFYSKHKIIPTPAIDQISNLYSTIFFSTVTVRRMDLALLKES